MNELGKDAMALLDAARDGDEPGAADVARVRARLGAKLAIGAAAAGAAVTVAATSSAGSAGAGSASAAGAIGAGLGGAAVVGAAAPIGLGMKILLVLGTATALSVGAVSYVESSGPPQAPSSSAPRATARASVVATAAPSVPSLAPVAAVAAVAASASAAPQPSVVAAAPVAAPAPASSLVLELDLIREAHAAMQSGDAARALVLVDEHARRHPAGALAEEREALRVLALCRLGRAAESRAAADRFLKAFARSPHASRVRATCAESP